MGSMSPYIAYMNPMGLDTPAGVSVSEIPTVSKVSKVSKHLRLELNWA